MSRRKKGNKGKSSIMLLISFCDFISSAKFLISFISAGLKKILCFDFNVDLRFRAFRVTQKLLTLNS